MSAERQSARHPPTESNSPAFGPEADDFEVPLTPLIDRADGRPPLAYRIERVHLRARARAATSELAASERRRQAIIDQYEHLLAERDEHYRTEQRDRATTPSGAGPIERLGRAIRSILG